MESLYRDLTDFGCFYRLRVRVDNKKVMKEVSRYEDSWKTYNTRKIGFGDINPG